MTTLTPTQIAEIEARADAATPGPWRVEEGTTLVWGDCNPDDTTSFGMGYPVALVELEKRRWAKKELAAEANAAFIARARQDIPALIAHARALEAENARLQAAIKFRSEAIAEQNAEGWTNEQRIAIRCAFDWLICAAVNRDEPLGSALWGEAADMLASMMPDHARQWRDLGEYRKRYEAAEAERDRLKAEIAELAINAARWRALTEHGRMRMMGCAGFDIATNKPSRDDVHIGVEVWSVHSAETSKSCVEMLTNYADHCIARVAAVKDSSHDD